VHQGLCQFGIIESTQSDGLGKDKCKSRERKKVVRAEMRLLKRRMEKKRSSIIAMSLAAKRSRKVPPRK